MADLGGNYWDLIAREQRENNGRTLWRRYCDTLHAGLLDRWLGARRFERALKTDLFDEAVGPGMFPTLASRSVLVAGIDVSHEIAAEAARCNPLLEVCRADVRRPPFADGEFDLIVSNSTLDHFDSRTALEEAIHELARLLRVGGHLVLTLDNPGNPAVWIRNHLPFRWLKRWGVVPYYVGVTAGHRWLRSALGIEGFEVLECTAIMHCPRMIAVSAAARTEPSGDGRTHGRLLRHLLAWERLEGYPTRFATGYFVAVHAARRANAPAGEL